MTPELLICITTWMSDGSQTAGGKWQMVDNDWQMRNGGGGRGMVDNGWGMMVVEDVDWSMMGGGWRIGSLWVKIAQQRQLWFICFQTGEWWQWKENGGSWVGEDGGWEMMDDGREGW